MVDVRRINDKSGVRKDRYPRGLIDSVYSWVSPEVVVESMIFLKDYYDMLNSNTGG
jgi:hypothetical protein